MKHLFILNDPPYGAERSYNALRLARELLKDAAAGNEAKLFLIGDAVACAKAGQKVAQGFYNVESMLHAVAARGAQVGVCGSCMDARGLADTELSPDCRRSSMAELATWTAWADKVVAF
jgi:uncharacterized protein involved in oxidation of intracellular sulfur